MKAEERLRLAWRMQGKIGQEAFDEVLNSLTADDMVEILREDDLRELVEQKLSQDFSTNITRVLVRALDGARYSYREQTEAIVRLLTSRPGKEVDTALLSYLGRYSESRGAGRAIELREKIGMPSTVSIYDKGYKQFSEAWQAEYRKRLEDLKPKSRISIWTGRRKSSIPDDEPVAFFAHIRSLILRLIGVNPMEQVKDKSS